MAMARTLIDHRVKWSFKCGREHNFKLNLFQVREKVSKKQTTTIKIQHTLKKVHMKNIASSKDLTTEKKITQSLYLYK